MERFVESQAPMQQLNDLLLWFIHARVFRSCCLVLLATTLSPSLPLYAADRGQLESMRQSVLALDSARQTALQEIGSSALSDAEKEDYRDFIVYLNTRIVNYCMELVEQGGAATVAGLPCPDAPAKGHGAGNQPPPDQQPQLQETFIYFPVSEPQETHTQAEKTASMDKQLFASLGEFDELLLKEEDKLSSRVPSQREAGDSGRDGTSGSGGGSGEAGGPGTAAGGDDGSGLASAGAGETGSGSATSGQAARGETVSGKGSGAGKGDAEIDHSAYGAPGGKLPPPEDDDIVARQLREAAEKETDPELKKKLWEEYWKYKGVKKGG